MQRKHPECNTEVHGRSTGYPERDYRSERARQYGFFVGVPWAQESKLTAPEGDDVTWMAELKMSPRLERMLEAEELLAKERGDGYLGTEHLLEAIVSDLDGVAGQILDRLGVPLRSEALNDNYREIPGQGPTTDSRLVLFVPFACSRNWGEQKA